MTDKQKQSGEAPKPVVQPAEVKEAQIRNPDVAKSQVRAERQGEFGQRANIGDRTPLQGMVTAEPLTGVAPSVVPAAPATPAANPASTPSDQAASGSTESSS
jgi:hypothetical protein